MSRKRLQRTRGGFTLIELMATMIVLGTILITMAPLLRWVSVQRREADVRQMALREVDNTLERIVGQPYELIAEESTGRVLTSDAVGKLLRDPRLYVVVAEVDDAGEAKQVTVELRWKDGAGNDVAPVRLTTWVYRRQS